jgi:hypothetical protein
MRLLFVRHASAGERRAWRGDDRLRPLDGRGRQQANALVALLAPFPLGRLLSSPFVRCVETVEPLAKARGLTIEEREELAEGAGLAPLRALGGELHGPAALCVHGDLLEALFGGGPHEKGSVWLAQQVGGTVRPERYLPPPV